MTINGTLIEVGNTFTIDLGTDINTTSVTATVTGKKQNSRGTIEFSNLLYTVEYTINKYTVIFKDWNGTTLDTQSIEYGSSAIAPDNPSREGYTFARWDTDYSSVKSNLTVTVIYTINKYTVTFIDHYEKTLKAEHVEQGSSVIPPNIPSKEDYTLNWDTDFSSVKSNLIVTVIYTINTYTITFKDYNRTTLKIQTTEYVSSLPTIDLLYRNLTNIVSVLYMFARCSSITSITFNQNCSFEKL